MQNDSVLPLTRKERFEEARTFHNQHGFQSTQAVIAATKVSSATINGLENNDEYGASCNAVVKLADHYGVSVGYLLKNSEMRNPDDVLQDISRYTGLCDEAVFHLHSYPVISRVLNALCVYNRTHLLEFCNYLDWISEKTAEIEKKIQDGESDYSLYMAELTRPVYGLDMLCRKLPGLMKANRLIEELGKLETQSHFEKLKEMEAHNGKHTEG